MSKLAVALQEPLAYLSLCGYNCGSETDLDVQDENSKTHNPEQRERMDNFLQQYKRRP